MVQITSQEYSGLFGSVQVTVNTEQLISTSINVSNKVDIMRQHFDELKQIMDRTKNYWIGDGGDTHREMYYSFLEDVENILNRLSEHPVVLLQMAGLYSEMESQIQSAVEGSLPRDVII